jgi:hypothetical protein
MVMSGVPAPMVGALRRVRRRMCGTRPWTCCAGRAGTRIRSEALHRMLSIGRPAAGRAGARPYQLTFTLDSNELLGQRKTRMAVRENSAPSRSWRGVACNALGRQAEALMQEAKAGAFAYTTARGKGWSLRLLTTARGKGWSLRLQLREAKARAFAYTTARGKGWSLRLLTTAGGKGWSLRLHNCGRQRLEPSLTIVR